MAQGCAGATRSRKGQRDTYSQSSRTARLGFMIRFILRFAIVAALAWLFAWLADRPGMVRVEWLGQRIEAPLVLAVLGLFACFVLGLWLIGLARRTIRAPRAVSNAVRSRRSRLGYESLSRG